MSKATPKTRIGDGTSRIRKGNGPAMLTSSPRLCMSRSEREASFVSLIKKRRKAVWTDDYRAKVVFS